MRFKTLLALEEQEESKSSERNHRFSDDGELQKSYEASNCHSNAIRNIKNTLEIDSGMNRIRLEGVLSGGERYRPRYKNLTQTHMVLVP